MTLGILIIAISLILSVWLYRKTQLEKKIIKEIPLVDWFNLIVFPIIIYIGLTITIFNIISRERINIIPTNDSLMMAMIVFLLLTSYVGNAIHFVAKVLHRYAHPLFRLTQFYKVNELFHTRLSHSTIFYSGLLLLFSIGLFEINYPLSSELNLFQEGVAFLSGIGLGVASVKSLRIYANYDVDKDDYYFRLIIVSLILLVLHVFTFNIINRKISEYQFNLFLRSYLGTIAFIYALRIIIEKFNLDKSRRMRNLFDDFTVYD